jgi:Ser/Thr protein kinase RdoA (MazF antagonist)
VLDALASVGIRGDGSLQALGSYENRVYLAGVEDATPVVAKFYRPQRWSDLAIGEEQAFVAELADREIPVVAPLALDGRTLHASGEFRFAVYPRCGGRAPELDRRETLEWMGRFLGRIHAVGALKAFAHRPASTARHSASSRATGCSRTTSFRGIFSRRGRRLRRRRSTALRAATTGPAPYPCCGSTATATPATCLWIEHGRMDDPTRGPHFVDFDDARMGPAVQDLWMLLSGDRADMGRQLGFVLAGYDDFVDFDRRELHLVEALRTLRLLHYSAWLAQRWDDPAFPPPFRGSTRNAIGRTGSSSCASRSR